MDKATMQKLMDDARGGYTRDQLQDIFSEICDPDNWKECIQAVIPASDFDLADKAVCYFTGYYVHIGA